MNRTVIALYCLIFAACICLPGIVAGKEGEPSGKVGGAIFPVETQVLNGGLANAWDREPLLMVDVTGYSLTGLIHRHLAVYSDGTASISSVTGIPGNQLADADVITVPDQAVQELRMDLRAAGAHQLRDNPLNVQDVPLTTVTFFFRSGPVARSNTFSYFLVFKGYERVGKTINDFIDTWFPGFRGVFRGQDFLLALARHG
ncbi:MAG: hypothetical protein ACYTG7_04950 [Planctomycetota bacterium]|jgi:hypothetical protein